MIRRFAAIRCWGRLQKFSVPDRSSHRRANFRRFAGWWDACFATGACSGALGCDYGDAATEAMARSKAHSLKQHRNR